MANKTSIYRKEIMKHSLEGNVHNFMRVYYPEYYKLSQEDQAEMRRLFYGDKVNSIYNSVLVDAIDRVNSDEDLLNTRLFDVKSNPMIRVNRVRGEHKDIAHKSYRCSEKTLNRVKEWFEVQYPKFVDRLVRDYGLEGIEDTDRALMKILMRDFKMTRGQAEKIVNKYYISENTISMLDKYTISGEKDTRVIEIKNQGKLNIKNTTKTRVVSKKIKEQLYCAKHSDEIFKVIKSKYPNVKTFIEAEGMPFTTSAYHQSRSTKRYSRNTAIALVKWYEANKPAEEKAEVVEVESQQVKVEVPERKEELERTVDLKPTIDILKKGMLGRKVVDEHKLSIMSRCLLSRLTNEELEDIRFIQEFEELEDKLKVNELSSLITNTEEYQRNHRRYEFISNDLKDLSKVIKF